MRVTFMILVVKRVNLNENTYRGLDNALIKFCIRLPQELRFTSSLLVMKKLKSHPHVIRLLGCVTESGTENKFDN